MSDDEADPELLELLRQSLGWNKAPTDEISSDTGVLRNAEFIYNNAIDVSVDMYGTKSAAAEIYRSMTERGYSTETWSQHELHPRVSDDFTEVDMVNFVFTMDLLNFSFWSELPQEERFQVDYRGQRWTGYNSLVACLRRALDEGVPITTPRFWNSPRCTDQIFQQVFRSATAESIPLLQERIDVLREASQVLRDNFADDEDEDDVDGADEDLDPSTINVAKTESSIVTNDEASRMDRDIDAHEPNDAFNTTANGDVGALSSEFEQSHIMESTKSQDRSENETLSGEVDDQIQNDLHVRRNSGPPQSNDVAATDDTGLSQPDLSETESGTRQQDLRPDHAVVRLIQEADQSGGRLVNLMAKHFSCFCDETRFEGRKVRLLKRAQIFVADIWAALNGQGLGHFQDIDHLTMFADYRVTQSLHSLGVLVYSPPLDHHIRSLKQIQSGHSWEVQLRGCSIWAIELVRREILKNHPDATNINAVLIDFFLYDLAKERESQGQHAIPHHRTRSIWY